ncbi:integrin alpha-X-like [Pelodytes ibericus]
MLATMYLKAARLTLVLLCLVFPSVGCFSVDTDSPIIFQLNDNSFGYQVVHMDNRVIVSAPLHQTATNRTGQLYQCTPQSGTCQTISINGNEDDVSISLGLSVAVKTNPSQLLACGPTLQRTCGSNIYMNGRCYRLNDRLQIQETLPPSLPECQVYSLDITLLIDGSGSISDTDFQLMLTFVTTVMEDFGKTDSQFSLMQYSSRFQTHFTFNQFTASRNPQALTRNIRQLTGQTRTSTAIYKVLTELFTLESGSRPKAQKVLIVITDGETVGETTPFQRSIGLAERMSVIRFAIGVGDAFTKQSAFNELRIIASPPTEDHILKVDDFALLSQFQQQLQEKIFAIEGTQSQTGSSFQMEMSQEGFSAILTPDGLALGAVGAYDWSGGASFYRTGESSNVWINATEEEKDMKDSYMGFSLLQVKQDVMAFGAPRYQHTGSVLIFQRHPTTSVWHKRAIAKGDKIGSYFGSVLSMVQVSSDPPKTLLLVGAPTYYSSESPGGRVYLCPVPANPRDSNMSVIPMPCPETLQGDTTHALGHFGSAISVLPDLTGDQVPDLAVGAPCEENNQGAVYIFAGKMGGFRKSYIQRIPGSLVNRGFMLFGRSMAGNLDLTNDGLPDLTVGSEGRVVLMKTRPVLGLSISMEFQPSEIPLSYYECPSPADQNKETVITVCLITTQRSAGHTGAVSAELRFFLLLDSGRSQTRAQFVGSGRSLEKTLQLKEGNVCSRHSFHLPECVDDSLSPLRVAFNFSMSGGSVLSADSPTNRTGQVSFQKNCGSDGVCQDDLTVTSNFAGLRQLVVGVSLEVNLTVSVKNQGDDSYNSRVLISYPVGLSYRRVSLVQSNKRVTVSCASLEGKMEVTCSINSPLLRPNTTAVFTVSFHVSPTADLGDTLTMTANVTSDNEGASSNFMNSSAWLRVMYGVYVTITSLENSTKYTNFSSSDDHETRPVQHTYGVINLGQHALPLSVFFMIPVKLKEIPLWEQTMIHSSQPGPTNCSLIRQTTTVENSQGILKQRPILDCSVVTCNIVVCNISNMAVGQAINFTISGHISMDWSKQTEQAKIYLQSSAEIGYDIDKYQHILEQKERFIQAQAQTALEVTTQYNYLPVIIGSSVGGLLVVALIAAGLYKLGFFKRQYKELMDQPASESTANQMPPQEAAVNEAPA